MYYVAVDIGCIECGAGSDVLGIFESEDEAHAVCREWDKLGWIGEQHNYEVFPVSSLNTPILPKFGDV